MCQSELVRCFQCAANVVTNEEQQWLEVAGTHQPQTGPENGRRLEGSDEEVSVGRRLQ